ncbi:MAG: NAD(P)/FAD-dependent oxidoreductase [Actinomycetota bacterium]
MPAPTHVEPAGSDSGGRSPSLAVIGGGSAAEQLCRAVAGDLSVTVYEPDLVGGECPFVACMPSKAMLHVARVDGSWEDAVAHRERVVEHRDDRGHAEELIDRGVRIRRHRAWLVGPNTVVDESGHRERYDHVVIATGAAAVIPPVDGIEDPELTSLVWTSEDVYRSTDRPPRVVVLGAGVIGHELAELYARTGSEVVVLERRGRTFHEHVPEVAQVVVDALTAHGVDFRFDVEVERVRPDAPGDGRGGRRVRMEFADGSHVVADRLVVAAGRSARTSGIGLDSVGLDEDEPLPVGRTGRVDAAGSLWAIGDAAGVGEYTHLANHHADVVADHLVGDATRTFDDAVLGACMFTSPPLITVGSSWASLRDDDDIVSVGVDVASLPRATTDRLAGGHLWAAASRSTRTVVAAAGAGPNFDELVHALVVAIDGAVPLDVLARTMQPFPTVGEILGLAWRQLHESVTD